MSDAALALARNHVVMALLPLMVVVLVVFLFTGFAVPVLPLHVHQELGYGAFVIGLMTRCADDWWQNPDDSAWTSAGAWARGP
jgi:hypothetical protein